MSRDTPFSCAYLTNFKIATIAILHHRGCEASVLQTSGPPLCFWFLSQLECTAAEPEHSSAIYGLYVSIWKRH